MGIELGPPFKEKKTLQVFEKRVLRGGLDLTGTGTGQNGENYTGRSFIVRAGHRTLLEGFSQEG
jgi:hypothetical protein